MKRGMLLLFLIIYLPCYASVAAPLKKDLNTLSLMTAYDLSNKVASSNLNLINKTGQALTVYGVYIYGIAWIHPGETCANGIDSGANSVQNAYMAGTIAAPISLAASQSVTVGQNYLYNMVYSWVYWFNTNGGASPCKLPGCTWTGDTGPFNWCFQLGAESPQSSYTYTPYLANVTPFAWPTSNSIDDYAYDLIPNVNNYVWLGPFTCNDNTLSCAAEVAQFQEFHS